MIKYLLLLMIIAGSSLGARSQTTDTLCFPVPVIQKVLIAARQKQAQDTLINILRSDIGILSAKIVSLQNKDSTNSAIVATYIAMVATQQEQVNILKKDVKKWKRKTRWTAIAGVVLAGGIIFLIK